MTNFEKAFKHMQAFEGGYANHPKDRGGETYRGIARRAWPKWAGWKIVDRILSALNGGKKWPTVRRNFLLTRKANRLLKKDGELDYLVMGFYRNNFWDAVQADKMPDRVGRKVFDTAVNMGTGGAARILQRALNSLGATLKVDGEIGPKTIKALKGAVKAWGEKEVLDKLCHWQASRYRHIVLKQPSQKVFLKGWLRRAGYRG